MCGLIGAFGVISHELRTRVFKDMLDVCASRGRDSTGVIKVDKRLDYTWVKNVGHPAMLYDTRTYERSIELGDAVALIGHTRSKTVGEVSIKNAHPFDFEDRGICGVHNGTLTGIYQFDEYHHSKVDSEILYERMANTSAEKVFGEIEGAWACVWWDNNTKTINFIRNAQRPLVFTWSKDQKTLFWASEEQMFGSIERKIDLWEGTKDIPKFAELPINQLYSFSVNPEAKGAEPVITMKPVKAIAPFARPVVVRPPVVNRYQEGNRHHAPGNYYASTWSRNEDGSVTRLEPPTPPEAQGKGGEVHNPFLVTDELLLDDPLPAELGQGSLDEGTHTSLSNVLFLRNSLNSSGGQTEQNISNSSPKSTLSLRGKGSTNSPPKSNDSSSEKPHDCSLTSPAKVNLLSTGVSHRTVAGVHYITNNKSGTEYEASRFLAACRETCSFCKLPVETHRDIGEILNNEHFICTTCIGDDEIPFDDPAPLIVPPKKAARGGRARAIIGGGLVNTQKGS